MQEEVENRTLTLVVSGTKFTGRKFKAAISKYMAHRKEKKLEKQRTVLFAKVQCPHIAPHFLHKVLRK